MTASSADCTAAGSIGAGDQSAEIAAAVTYEDDLLRAGKELRDFLFDGLGRNIVAGIEDDEVLDAADDAPIAANVHFALIAGVKPAVAQDARGFFWAVPIAGKDVRAADYDFFVFADFHFDAVDRRTHVAGARRDTGIVHGADAGRFREAVDLENGNAQHEKEMLRFRS